MTNILAPSMKSGFLRLINLLQGTPMAERAEESIEVRHLFACGVYVRELHIKAKTLAIGKEHKHSTINILSKGTMMLKTDDGDYKITAPASFRSEPSVRKLAFAVTDCVISNVHPWDGLMTLEELEQNLTVDDSEAQQYIGVLK